MPYFPDKNCLFIHIPKCAGTYVENHLDLPLSFGLLDRPSPRTRISKKIISKLKLLINKESDQQIVAFAKRRMLFGYGLGGFALQHATLAEILGLRLIDPPTLQSSFVFSVHRDPIHRAISVYKYWNFNRKMSFSQFCEDVIANPWRANLTHSQLTHLRRQVDFVMIDGYIPDYVKMVPLHALNDFLIKISDQFGWPKPSENPLNVSESSNDFPLLTKDVDLIQERYAADFEAFGYQHR